MDPSDLVQQTLLDALDAYPTFLGTAEQELLAWLRTILARNVHRASPDDSRQQRDEAASIEDSAVRIEGLYQAKIATPSEQAIRTESIFQLCDAVEELPETQRQAIILHHWDG